MDEFAPEDFMEPAPGGEIEALSEAFFAAGGDSEAIEEDLDDDPIEPMDV